ncbi:MAG: hypothetical protein WKG03_02990 [Telluria sp.]
MAVSVNFVVEALLFPAMQLAVLAEIGDNARFFPIARPVVINACCCAA